MFETLVHVVIKSHVRRSYMDTVEFFFSLNIIYEFINVIGTYAHIF